MLFKKVSTAQILLLTFLLLVLGCKREKTNWDADFTIPIAQTSLTPKNFLGDSLFNIDTSNNIVFSYKGKIDGLANEIITVPDTSIRFQYQNFLGNVALAPGTLLPNISYSTEFNLKSIKLKKAKLSTGSIIITAKNYSRVPLKITLAIPNAKLNNVPLLSTSSIAGKLNGIPGLLNSTISLADYDLNLLNTSTNTYNSLGQSIILAVDDNAPIDTIFFLDSVAISVKFSGLTPEYVTGYFGKLEQTFVNGPTLFDFKKVLNAEQIQLEKANLDLKFNNFIGVDLRADLSNFSGKNTDNGSIKSLKLNNNSPIRLNLIRASSISSIYEPITPSETNYSFNNNNSNIVEFLNNIPNELNLNGKFTLNPLDLNINNYNDFYKRNKLIETNYEIKVPGKFSFKNLKLQVDGVLEIENKDDLDGFKDGKLILYSTNNFPYQIQLQGYFLNEQNQIVDSLFGNKANIDAAIDNNLNATLSPAKNRNDYLLNENQKFLLKHYKNIRWIAVINTNENKLFEIKNNYTLDLKLVAEAVVNLKYD
jgi:hypothetical protein